MRDTIVIAPSTVELDAIAEMLSGSHLTTVTDDGARLWAENRETGVGVELIHDQSVAEHYEDEDGAKIEFVGHDPKYYVVHFRSIDSLRRMLISIASPASFAIDNDFGIIEPLSAFIGRWSEDPSWDWIK